MKKIYVKEEWCLGCHLCEYYCAFANSEQTDMVQALKGVTIHPRIQIEQKGKVSYAVSCRHCEEPLCVKSCITGALHISDGIVEIDKDKCVGCCTCVLTCPYGAVMPTEMGIVQKCELCASNSAGSPACVKGCPNRAIVFEDKEGTA